MKRRTLLFSTAATLAVPSLGRAQAWPANPVRLMHGYDAGSNPDTIARHLAPSLTEILGVQIMVEPKPGAAERLAATQIARLKPDGGVLYLMTGGQAVVSATDKTLSYDVLRDFDFISIVTRFPFVFTVAPDSRFKTIEAFLDEAKREPGKLTYGTSGVGSTLHMAMELLLSQTGAQITHVPYKGGIGTPYNDLIGGRLDMHVVTFSNAQPLLKTDKLRALPGCHGERAQLVGLEQRLGVGEGHDMHVEPATDQVVVRGADAALVGHMGDLGAGLGEQQLHRHVQCRADARGAVGELARLLAASSRKASMVLKREFGRDGEDEGKRVTIR